MLAERQLHLPTEQIVQVALVQGGRDVHLRKVHFVDFGVFGNVGVREVRQIWVRVTKKPQNANLSNDASCIEQINEEIAHALNRDVGRCGC